MPDVPRPAVPLELSKAGRRIQSIGDWEVYAAPKGKARHWEDGRSAKELARAWCEPLGKPAPPNELLAAFRHHPTFCSLQLVRGFPEDRASFDSFPGEPRNADLNLLGRIGDQLIAISVEGKADESFGPSVAGALRTARKRKQARKATNAPARIRALAAALFPGTVVARRAYLELSYQLLTGVGGTLALANRLNARTALFVIHEFVGGTRADGTPATKESKIARNAAALDRFITALVGEPTSITPGQILGPFGVPGNAHIPASVSLYIGKVRTRASGSLFIPSARSPRP